MQNCSLQVLYKARHIMLQTSPLFSNECTTYVHHTGVLITELTVVTKLAGERGVGVASGRRKDEQVSCSADMSCLDQTMSSLSCEKKRLWLGKKLITVYNRDIINLYTAATICTLQLHLTLTFSDRCLHNTLLAHNQLYTL